MADAAWQENRGGELYFVEADKTAAGWVFSERSTYEVRWFRARAKAGWIDKAERFSSRPVPTIVDSDSLTEQPKIAGALRVEVGDFYDNASVLALANWKINQGAVEEGLAMLNILRSHIAAIDEQKSHSVLLPAIDEAIEREYRKQTEGRQAAPAIAIPKATAATEIPPLAATNRMLGHPPGDVVSRFKLHMIDVVAIVTALTWTHSMLVHEIARLPGLATNQAGANVVAGSVLAVVLHLVSRGGRS